MEKRKEKSLLSRLSIKEYVDNVKVAIEELEQMEMGENKLERYRNTKVLIKESSKSVLKVFLWRALVFMVFFLLFILVVIYSENNIVQIVSFVVLGIFGMYLISPMLPSPFVPYQDKLKKMMKKDGVKYRDCTMIKK